MRGHKNGLNIFELKSLKNWTHNWKKKILKSHEVYPKTDLEKFHLILQGILCLSENSIVECKQSFRNITQRSIRNYLWFVFSLTNLLVANFIYSVKFSFMHKKDIRQKTYNEKCKLNVFIWSPFVLDNIV